MENRNTLCDRCGRLFAGMRGLNIHRSRSTICIAPRNQNQETDPVVRPPEQLEVQNQEEQDDFRDHMFFTPEEEYIDPIQIEGYSLNYITIPADLFQNLENEQQIGGRYQSLTQFAVDSTTLQYQKQIGVVELFTGLVGFISLSAFWAARIFCIASMSLALYYSHIGQCSPTVHHIMGATN